jgi:hypothetical protein
MSPGLDRMTPSFYKSYWYIIGEKVIEVVQYFFVTGYPLKALNHTFITFILKNDRAHKVEYFRPISLYNVVYKIITKILSNRMKPFLYTLIKPSQTAFIPNRVIDENIIASEIMHHINRKRGQQELMAIKVGMVKAYDKWNGICS